MHVPRLLLVLCLVAARSLAAVDSEPSSPPNIVFILGDDIGYGDFGCYGATKIKTPHIDRLAQQGVRFTDAHSPSAMCTPTRYAFMTGRYAWRQPAGASVLSGIAPLCIAPGSATVASILKQAGYATGVVGKWHLGLGEGETDYNRPIKPGPLEVGFDYAFILPATGDRVPCVYVENHNVVGYDPADPIRLDYTVASRRSGIVRPGDSTNWRHERRDDGSLVRRRHGRHVREESGRIHRAAQSRPFFLYLATHDAHVPRVPHARFRGSSQAGVRGDVIQEFDATVGRVLEALDRLKLSREHAGHRHERQRWRPRFEWPRHGQCGHEGDEQRPPSERRPAWQQGKPIRRRSSSSFHRPLAAPDQSRNCIRSIDLPCRYDCHFRRGRKSTTGR